MNLDLPRRQVLQSLFFTVSMVSVSDSETLSHLSCRSLPRHWNLKGTGIKRVDGLPSTIDKMNLL